VGGSIELINSSIIIKPIRITESYWHPFIWKGRSWFGFRILKQQGELVVGKDLYVHFKQGLGHHLMKIPWKLLFG
jgi:xylose isomerase